jgi:hypothetical protein
MATLTEESKQELKRRVHSLLGLPDNAKNEDTKPPEFEGGNTDATDPDDPVAEWLPDPESSPETQTGNGGGEILRNGSDEEVITD